MNVVIDRCDRPSFYTTSLTPPSNKIIQE